MTITDSRARDRSKLYKLVIPLATSAKGYYPDEVEVKRGTFTAQPAGTSTDAFSIGSAIENYDQTAGDTTVQVELHEPVDLEWFTNDGNIAIATDFLAKCYFLDARSVTKTKNSSSINHAYAGQIWAVDATRGVGVRRTANATADALS
jgi:hypothetical protein